MALPSLWKGLVKRMKDLKTAIVITAYNRALPLEKLLKSLCAVTVPEGKAVDLIISIDNGGTEEVNALAEQYEWHGGEKRVIIHESRLGLKKHFIWVGDRTEEYDSIIFLEDDLIVSPHLFCYYEQLLEKYYSDPRVAGMALYSPALCEFDHKKFYPIEDGYSVYFLCHPYWGTVWFKNEWREFKCWLENEYEYKPELLPKAIVNWRDTSFKKTYIQFIIEKGKTFVYPRTSLVSNAGAAGEHNTKALCEYEVKLALGEGMLSLPELSESKAVYDAFFELDSEIVARQLELDASELLVNIRGLKGERKKYELTSLPTGSVIRSFSSQMKPAESAVFMNVEGSGLYLVEGAEACRKSVDFCASVCDDVTAEYGELEAKTLFSLFKRKLKFFFARKR